MPQTRIDSDWNPDIKLKVFDKTYSDERLLGMYQRVVDEAVLITKLDAIDDAETYIPKRTGQLRDSVIRWITRNWKRFGGHILLDVVTSVPYAFDILGNPIHKGTWREHSGALATAYYYGFNGVVYLYDPQAVANWYDILALKTKNNLSKNLTIAVGMEVN